MIENTSTPETRHSSSGDWIHHPNSDSLSENRNSLISMADATGISALPVNATRSSDAFLHEQEMKMHTYSHGEGYGQGYYGHDGYESRVSHHLSNMHHATGSYDIHYGNRHAQSSRYSLRPSPNESCHEVPQMPMVNSKNQTQHSHYDSQHQPYPQSYYYQSYPMNSGESKSPCYSQHHSVSYHPGTSNHYGGNNFSGSCRPTGSSCLSTETPYGYSRSITIGPYPNSSTSVPAYHNTHQGSSCSTSNMHHGHLQASNSSYGYPARNCHHPMDGDYKCLGQHNIYYPLNHMISRSGSSTPSSLIESKHHEKKECEDPQLTTSFSSELDDYNSRSSSPVDIPTLSKMQHVSMTAPARIRIPEVTREKCIGIPEPPYESFQNDNLLYESSSIDTEEFSDNSFKRDNNCHHHEALAPIDVQNPSSSIHEASLLLGLRTSCSDSPATIPTVTENSDAEALDDDVTLNSALTSTSQTENKILGNTSVSYDYYIPPNYPTRLSMPGDRTMLNSLHCFTRTHLLELFVIDTTKKSDPSASSAIGRVGFRCVFCHQARQCTGISQNEAPMAVFYPKSVQDIYRMVTSWQRCHLRKCRNLPPSIRSQLEYIRSTEKARGKTAFWLSSAKEIGLVNCTSRAGGVRFAPPPHRLQNSSSNLHLLSENMPMIISDAIPSEACKNDYNQV